ncbi:zf-HC2 domain-containing protein [Streptomyces sp. H10-C2]|uniref:zf-HC2 domain-containing protein n=1 Tax=unclassified Streptomyces TaxID=2593676 RepID=UPI0024B9BD48|nr:MULTISPECIES: zf-HC2 domain-containing protein [unclassified Streptomyces]MDJ0342008.1 zf-HC2 domain-containing protein [Streptomyces sp. PH10-H1]MDJ0369981.1 zf-HC2 domain-containing protein [Streptomyces sp. H10-C2]MDJ0370018.1 zf-HC2 domain-containing protein [Streptomyces sp. H10-C2]
MTSPKEQHADVGAYVLGLLDDADATRFETHLADCELCATEFDALAGLEPLLAEFAAATPDPSVLLDEGPGEDLLDRLLDDIADARARTRRRRFSLIAAAAVLIIGGPLITLQATSGHDSTPAVAEHVHGGPAEAAFHLIPAADKVSATDPTTKVTATIGVEKKDWGSHVVLQLGNVKGPLRCRLIAVGRNGEEQTVTTWAVPAWGYGIADSPHDSARAPLYMHGGAAMQPGEVDHYEVRTLDGKPLVAVKA